MTHPALLAAVIVAVAGCATAATSSPSREATSCVVTPERRAAWLQEYRESGARESDSGPDLFCGVSYNDYINLVPTHGNTLYDVLKARGITEEKVVRIHMALGDAPGEADIVDAEAIDSFWWDYFRPAEPYKYWLPTRPHLVSIFVEGQAHPAAVLRVNETDSTGIGGDEVTYMCHGLFERVLEEVKNPRVPAHEVFEDEEDEDDEDEGDADGDGDPPN